MTEKKKSNTVLIIVLAVLVLGAVGYGYMKYSTETGGPGGSSGKATVNENLLAKAKQAEQAGDTDQALEYYQEFLTINAQPPDLKNPAVGTVHASMGNIYFKKFKYPKAIEHFKTALDHAILHIGKQSQEAGERWFSLASIYDKQGEVKTALEHYQNSRAIQAKLGEDTSDVDQVILALEDYMLNAKLQTQSSL